MTPKVGIILLNWNGKQDTLECLTSLRQIHYPCYEIIVVDNGSLDDSVMAIQSQFPEIILLQNPMNLGFATGNNRGIEVALASGCQYVLLLNNDTLVAPDFLRELVNVGERYTDIGMLNPLIYHANSDRLWFGAGMIDWHNGIAQHETDLSHVTYLMEYGNIIRSEYLTGCALLVKAAVINKIGGLDARFFAYYEDADWSVRCQKAGWKTVVVPTARIWHKVSASAPPERAFMWGHRNLILFLWKHSSLWQFPFRFRRAVYKCLHEFTWHRERALGEAAMHGLWSAVTLRFGKEIRKMPDWLISVLRRHIKYVLWLCK